ncbi:UDP-N-acetylmuramoyl-tripeptide--D-alanyl-D-alanine ligase [uncultured Psychroserpens sp.]|uniref:UDP-N-acetylmuramoyl-tripeptide--D-alanyl-D- alanine ligase n=1 Tax=uncultured Psychroserpens sp. TaxID=255436 RepID=UPI00262C6D3C|nr:UDP-N-acetylmuramoyl-tripeptide--D-alanyl-D-alanine ligase [uncultured Psychroserpens sp.]
MTIKTIYQAFLECNSVSTDTRKISMNSMFFALRGENFNGNTFAYKALKKGAKYTVVDEKEYANNENCILVNNVLETLQNLATFHRKTINIPIIALTGSNGKTTTKELINAVLSTTYKTSATKGNLNNHIGVPLTLLEMTKDTQIGIVEMGANHQKEISFLSNITLPDYGLITNFGKAHLEGFGGVEGVIKGKSELYEHLKANNKTIFVNTNDRIQINQVGNYDKIIAFGSEIKMTSSQPYVNLNFDGYTIKSNITGAYNYNNIAVAIAIGKQFKVNEAAIVEAIENYIPSNNRSQIIEKKSNKIILDAYNANPTSMKAALDNFSNLSEKNKIAILGDMFELGDDTDKEHQYISDYASQLDIDKIYLVGEHFSRTELNSKKINSFKLFKDLKTELTKQSIIDSLLLIKGSRGMALERTLEVF